MISDLVKDVGRKQEYHTYTLPEEKKAHVVIKGLTTDIESSELKPFLKEEHRIL